MACARIGSKTMPPYIVEFNQDGIKVNIAFTNETAEKLREFVDEVNTGEKAVERVKLVRSSIRATIMSLAAEINQTSLEDLEATLTTYASASSH